MLISSDIRWNIIFGGFSITFFFYLFLIINRAVGLLDNKKGFNLIVDPAFNDQIAYFIILFVTISGSIGNYFINLLYGKLFDTPMKILENETFKKGFFFY